MKHWEEGEEVRMTQGQKKVCRLAASDVREIPRTLSNSLENMLKFIKFENLDGNVTLGLIKQ